MWTSQHSEHLLWLLSKASGVQVDLDVSVTKTTVHLEEHNRHQQTVATSECQPWQK